jgi:hypothetical protein
MKACASSWRSFSTLITNAPQVAEAQICCHNEQARLRKRLSSQKVSQSP